MDIHTKIILTVIEVAILLVIGSATIYALILGAPFVPTPIARVRKMLELAKIKPGEKVYDLGCGDGRLVHIASKEHKAEAIGFELSPLIYIWAKICQPFWRSKGKIKFRNFYQEDISDADVVICYLMPGTMKRLEPHLKKLKKGTRIISYAFRIPNMKLIHEEPKMREKNLCPVWVYEI